MKKPGVPEALHRHLFPRPKSNDPVTFNQFISRSLVPEVRMEVQTFYGTLENNLEAMYPGLDYTFAPHRRRLGRFPNHRRLFKAFEELGLTNNEILSICIWEGTRCAKEKYERDNRQKIPDTTLLGVEEVRRRGEPMAERPSPIRTRQSTRLTGRAGNALFSSPRTSKNQPRGAVEERDEESDVEQTDEDEYDHSVGVSLNQQLRAAADARARGEQVSFDQQWEQWLRQALEREDHGLDHLLASIQSSRPFPAASNAPDNTTYPTPPDGQALSTATEQAMMNVSRPTTAISSSSSARLTLAQLQARRSSLLQVESAPSSSSTASDIDDAMPDLRDTAALLAARTGTAR